VFHLYPFVDGLKNAQQLNAPEALRAPLIGGDGRWFKHGQGPKCTENKFVIIRYVSFVICDLGQSAPEVVDQG
jgi:hypothetical protein